MRTVAVVWVFVAVVLVLVFGLVDGDTIGANVVKAVFGATGGAVGTVLVDRARFDRVLKKPNDTL
jgi:hypothetical protein